MDKIDRWRLILGKNADPQEDVPLQAEAQGMDNTLEALYDSQRKGALGSSSPNVNRWLGDIRKYFPVSVVQLMQRDALQRLQLQQMLLEPELLESVEPDINLIGTLLSLNKIMPSQTRETAKQVVRKVVEALEKKLRAPLRQAVEGALSRSVRNRRPRHNEIDWSNTIRLNLKHYQPTLRTVIPDRIVGYGKKGRTLRQVFLLIDQSGSMAASVVYSSVFGAVLASIRSIQTRLIVFDTAVVDLTMHLSDPVDLLFSTQLGGGTDIAKALKYTESLLTAPADSIVVLISDLFEGGNRLQMLKTVEKMQQSGVQIVILLALNDEGAPAYDHENAQAFAQMDIPTFACTPDLFPSLMAAVIGKQNIWEWAGKQGVAVKG